ncbi:hypothetical protein T10_1106 [Trichinella papuae]|uniref:Uncharacterized protein n=1 Tax=Trichinella papuae TaxID=268474 RepID=A0A0V1M0L5_9BILA|nr:hypothetical protein T10_1106 [Trichinella papuae]
MKSSDLHFPSVHKSVLNTVAEQVVFPLIDSLWDYFLEVLKSPYQPAVEYEQADVSTADFNKIFLIFIIKKCSNIFI